MGGEGQVDRANDAAQKRVGSGMVIKPPTHLLHKHIARETDGLWIWSCISFYSHCARQCFTTATTAANLYKLDVGQDLPCYDLECIACSNDCRQRLQIMSVYRLVTQFSLPILASKSGAPHSRFGAQSCMLFSNIDLQALATGSLLLCQLHVSCASRNGIPRLNASTRHVFSFAAHMQARPILASARSAATRLANRSCLSYSFTHTILTLQN